MHTLTFVSRLCKIHTEYTFKAAKWRQPKLLNRRITVDKKEQKKKKLTTTKRNAFDQNSPHCYSSKITYKEKQRRLYEHHIIISSTREECSVTCGDPTPLSLDRPLHQLSFLKPLWSRKPYVSWTENESCSILMCSHVGTLCLPLAQKWYYYSLLHQTGTPETEARRGLFGLDFFLFKRYFRCVHFVSSSVALWCVWTTDWVRIKD